MQGQTELVKESTLSVPLNLNLYVETLLIDNMLMQKGGKI